MQARPVQGPGQGPGQGGPGQGRLGQGTKCLCLVLFVAFYIYCGDEAGVCMWVWGGGWWVGAVLVVGLVVTCGGVCQARVDQSRPGQESPEQIGQAGAQGRPGQAQTTECWCLRCWVDVSACVGSGRARIDRKSKTEA